MPLSFKPDNSARGTRLHKPAAVSRHGVVASQHRRASEIGIEVLAAGGTAFDAAVAVSFALGVLEPWMSGPFGGGAMMVAQAGQPVETLFYGMRAPRALDPADYPLAQDGHASDLFPWKAVEGDRNVHGPLAVAVPGTVAGIGALHARHGTLPWAELLAPAIAAAREGLLVDWYAALMIGSRAEALAKDPAAAAMFLERGQWPRGAGWTSLAAPRIDMSAMAATLAQLAAAGPGDLYTGDLARVLIGELQAGGNRMTLDDLAGYRAEWQRPLSVPYRASTFHLAPEMTAGPTLAEMLACLDGLAPPPGAAPAPQDYVAWAESLRQAYRKRLDSAGDDGGNDAPAAPACTTHFAICDRQGNMVSMTQTLLSAFGASVVSPGTGLLMNNGIMWFDPEPGRPNALGPGKRCLMNVCPAIVDHGARRVAVGAAGGRKILPAVAQLSLMLTEHGLSPEEAIHAPRIDVSGGETVVADAALPPEALAALGARYDTAAVPRAFFPLAFACPSAVIREGDTAWGITEPTMPWAEALGVETEPA